MVAEAIGDNGNTKIKQLQTKSKSITAYAFYDGDDLKRLALINHDIVGNKKDSSDLKPFKVAINGPNKKRVQLKRLSADNTYVKHRITWGGQTMYKSPDGRLQGKEVREAVDTSDSGDFVVAVDSSSAVLIFFD
jgi:hypothetical protein